METCIYLENIINSLWKNDVTKMKTWRKAYRENWERQATEGIAPTRREVQEYTSAFYSIYIKM
jgi:hypothetical protein